MNTLTNTSFKNLTKTEQVVMLINSGKELLTRDVKGYTIHLVLLADFFVEVWYESNTKKIVNVEPVGKDHITRNYAKINELVKQLIKE